MKTKIITFITLACAVIILYAAPPKTMSTCGDNLYIALDWNKPTPDLSEALFKKLIKAQTDSTYLFLSFYEDGLIDENEFIENLALFGKKPDDFGFDMNVEFDDDLKDLFESEEN